MTTAELEEIVLVKGQGFVRKSDDVPVDITDGAQLVTYCSINADFPQVVRDDIEKRRTEMPEGTNGFFIHGMIPLDRSSKNTDVQMDYLAFVYAPR